MVIEQPVTDLQEAYRNRARIEKARLTENIKLRHDGLSEFNGPHYPIRVRKKNYQHKGKATASTKTREAYQQQAHVIFEPETILPYTNHHLY